MRSRSDKICPEFSKLDDIIDYERGLNDGESICKPYTTHKIHELATIQEQSLVKNPDSKVRNISNRKLNELVKENFESVSTDRHRYRIEDLKQGIIKTEEATVSEIYDRHFTHGENEKTRVAHGGAIHLFYMTSQCNLDCNYCYQHLEGRPKHLPEPPLIANLIDNIMESDRPDEQTLYCIFGGEPLMEWENCKFLMDYAYKAKHNCHFNITSNGILLSKPAFFKKVTAYLEEFPEIKQRVSFDISFDGVGSQDRVYYSGKDSTLDVLKCFGNIMEYNKDKSREDQIRWRCRYTIHRSNVMCFAKDMFHIATTYGPDRVVTSLDNKCAEGETPEDEAKIKWLLKEQIDWLREKWRRNLINYPVCSLFCDMCNSCGEKKDHRFYYSQQGLARIQNVNVRVGEEFFDFPDADPEIERELPKVGLPKTMFDRLGIVDTFGQGSGTEHLQETKFAEDGKSFPC